VAGFIGDLDGHVVEGSRRKIVQQVAKLARYIHRLCSSSMNDMLEAVQRRLNLNPGAMRQRREVVEHPFGTIKLRMGATHFLMKRLPKVTCEMALHVLAYNLTRVLNILGVQPLMAALRA
jgi:transposase